MRPLAASVLLAVAGCVVPFDAGDGSAPVDVLANHDAQSVPVLIVDDDVGEGDGISAGFATPGEPEPLTGPARLARTGAQIPAGASRLVVTVETAGAVTGVSVAYATTGPRTWLPDRATNEILLDGRHESPGPRWEFYWAPSSAAMQGTGALADTAVVHANALVRIVAE